MRFLEAVVDTLLGVCDTTPKGQGNSWPKQTQWPTDGTPGPKGDGTHWTHLI